MSLRERWSGYQPSKTATFWVCVLCIVGTMIVGFTWGGWMTAGTAMQKVREAEEQARAKVVAALCVERFKQTADASAKLTELKEMNSWRRGEFVETGGWARMPGSDESLDEAADLCAERLAKLEPPLKKDKVQAASAGEPETVVQ